MKKALKSLLLLGLLGAALLLNSCGKAEEKKAESNVQNEEKKAEGAGSTGVKTIRFFHRFPDEPYNSFIEEKLKEYEAAHPDIHFEITSAQNQEYKEKLKIVVGGDDTPDIFFSWQEISRRDLSEKI